MGRCKGQLTQTFCERLFCILSNARIGVSSRRSRLQVAVGCAPKWTATALPSGRVDSGIFLAVCGRLAAVEKLRRECRVHATATSRLRPV